MTFPLRFLEGEDIANNFLFNADRQVSFFEINGAATDVSRMLPLPIYN